MAVVIAVLLGGALLSLSACLLGIQNKRVYQLRTAVLAQVSNASRADIEQGRTWEWRYDEFNAISYERQMLTVHPSWPRDPARAEQ